MTDTSIKYQFRLAPEISSALDQLAKQASYETTAYIQMVLTRHVLKSGILKKDDHRRLEASEDVIKLFIELAKKLKADGKFDAHFQRTVFMTAMEDQTLRETYELAVGGDAFTSGLPGKTPLNMYLGWYIKNAVGAEVQMVGDKPARASVRNAPIQSYTLLQEASA